MKNLKNNKGFSLVELIIVVAIMAILIGILAPQYIKYVEKSRVSADEDVINEVRKACEVAVVDPDSKITSGFTITFGSGNATFTNDNSGAIKTALKEFVDMDNTKMKSKEYKNRAAGSEAKITVTFTNNVPQVTVSGMKSGS